MKDREAGKFRVGRWFPLRTRRGYGIHSPFAYSLIRSVFGPERTKIGNYGSQGSNREISGIRRKTAERIERLYRVCECENIETGSSISVEYGRRTLFIATAAAGTENLISLRSAAEADGGILCMVDPKKNSIWRELCSRIAREHDGMVVESRDLMIIFSDKGLNKQHIRV